MLCLKDFEEYAKKHLDRQSWSYFSQGAERNVTLRENLRGFTRYNLIPRMLRGAPDKDLSVSVLGERISMPIGICPVGHQKLAHPEGELAAARAASEAGVVYTLSSISNSSIKDVANSRSNKSPLWMQLYIFKNRMGARNIIQRAESNGYKALVLTVDTPVIGLQLKMQRSGLHIPPHISVPNLDDVLEDNPGVLKDTKNHISNTNFLDDNLTWEDVAWVKSLTKLPIVLKGILTVEDALLAVKYGASAVWVSNHGGRQLDCAPFALDVLPNIASALAGTSCEVYVDGGVRWGSDILKALALGARAVFVGRPVIWGLAHSGQDGVRSVLDILRSELHKAMHLAGCTGITDIGPHLIQKKQFAKI